MKIKEIQKMPDTILKYTLLENLFLHELNKLDYDEYNKMKLYLLNLNIKDIFYILKKEYESAIQ